MQNPNIPQFTPIFLKPKDLWNITVSYEYHSHFNKGPCMKRNQPAPLRKTNLYLHVPLRILISRNVLYLISYRNLKLMIQWQTSVYRKFRRNSWILVYRNGICYSKELVSYRKPQQWLLSFVSKDGAYSIVMMKKDFCKSCDVHTTLKNGDFLSTV
jgi:hypothetical protein